MNANIDFTKYRQPELGEHLGAIINIPETVGLVLKWTAIAVLVVWALVGICFYGQAHWTLLSVVFCYATLCAVIVGGLVGLVAVAHRRLGNLLRVVDITFEISEQVTADVAQVRAGDKEMPSARQITYGVYEFVVLPTVENVVRRQSRLLGGVLFRVYRWSLGRALTRVLKAAPHAAATDADGESQESSQMAKLDDMEASAQSTQQWIAENRAYLATMGDTVRRVALIPLIIVAGIATTFAALSLTAIWYLI